LINFFCLLIDLIIPLLRMLDVVTFKTILDPLLVAHIIRVILMWRLRINIHLNQISGNRNTFLPHFGLQHNGILIKSNIICIVFLGELPSQFLFVLQVFFGGWLVLEWCEVVQGLVHVGIHWHVVGIVFMPFALLF